MLEKEEINEKEKKKYDKNNRKKSQIYMKTFTKKLLETF